MESMISAMPSDNLYATVVILQYVPGELDCDPKIMISLSGWAGRRGKFV
jgi:hypothetical protein